MKKKYGILSLILGTILLITACGESEEFVLEGTLGTAKGEKILVIYDDPIAKVDSIIPKEGKFEYSFVPDTITLIRLVDKDGNSLPVFANKGWNVQCKGNFIQPKISGNGPNNELQEFRNSIKDLKEDPEKVAQKAEEFITTHQFSGSYSSVYSQT